MKSTSFTIARDSAARRGLSRWWLVAAVGGLLAWVSFFAADTVGSAEARAFRSRFQTAAEETVAELRHSLNDVVTELDVLGDLIHSNPDLNRQGFRRLSRGVLERTERSLTVEWIPRVPHSQRESLEIRARQDGMPTFRFTERVDGAQVDAAVRPVYFPVYYVEPVAGNEKAIGFDLASNPSRRAALEQAARTGRPVASERLNLVQETSEQAGILLFFPVYEGEESNPEGGSQLLGFTLGVLRMSDFVKSVVPAGYGSISEFRILDQTGAGVPDVLLCGDESPTKSPYDSIDTPLEFAGRQWLVSCTPSAAYLATESHVHETVLILGLLLAAALSTLTAWTTGQTRRVSRIVDARTHDLTAATARANLLNKVASVVSDSGDFEDALLRTIRSVRSFLDWPIGHVYLRSSDNPEELVSSGLASLAPGVSKSQLQEIVLATQSCPEGGLPGRVLRAGRSSWESDMLGDCDAAAGFRGAVGMPVIVEGTTEAVLEFVSTEVVELDAETLATLDAVAGQLNVVLDRQRSAMALRSNAQRLDLAIRAANEGLWDWQVKTGETFFSDTFYTMLGYEPGELPMTLDTWKDLCHPDDLQSALQDIEDHFSGRTDSYRNEHRLRRKDGTWHWIHDVGEIVERDTDGSPTRMIGVHLDIQEQREARDAAESANLAKSEFLANMSHEIRTPMTAILGFADILAESPSDFGANERTRAIRTIQSNAKHLLTVINDILDMSKIEAGKMSVEHLPTDPARVVNGVVSLLSSRAAGKGIQISAEYATAIPESIDSDPTRLRQILLNLVGNALKFTEIGTVLIRVSASPEQQTLRFEVIDSGIGMSEEQVTALSRFDAFRQGDSSTSRKFGGTGLGLRISNKLCQLLGGDLTIQSSLGEGTTLAVTIATGDLDRVTMRECGANTRVRRSKKKSPTGKQRPLDGMRLLYAEDGPDNQRLVSHILRKAGATVEIVENGRLAVDATHAAEADGEPFDVVLMDMQMPVLDGYGATTELRERGYSGAIVALTAHAMASDRERCLACGCDDFATKPIDRESLFHTILASAKGHQGAHTT